MSATSPEDIFQRAMADGDLDAVLDVYDPEAVFLNQSGKVTTSREELREALAPRAAMKARFEYEVRQVVRAGDIALMHTKWVVSEPERADVYAIEVARRQADGTWRWLIGDPFTVGREVGSVVEGARREAGDDRPRAAAEQSDEPERAQ